MAKKSKETKTQTSFPVGEPDRISMTIGAKASANYGNSIDFSVTYTSSVRPGESLVDAMQRVQGEVTNNYQLREDETYNSVLEKFGKHQTSIERATRK